MSRIDNPMLDKVNMLCVDDRVRQLRLNHVHNIVHNRAPNYLYHNFVSVNLNIIIIIPGLGRTIWPNQ